MANFFSRVGIAQAQSESAVASWTCVHLSSVYRRSGNCDAVFAMASPFRGQLPDRSHDRCARIRRSTGSVHVNGTLVESGKDQSLGHNELRSNGERVPVQPQLGQHPSHRHFGGADHRPGPLTTRRSSPNAARAIAMRARVPKEPRVTAPRSRHPPADIRLPRGLPHSRPPTRRTATSPTAHPQRIRRRVRYGAQ